MKSVSDIIGEMRTSLDDMAANAHQISDPEWAYINAIRFMENYRVMRALELNTESPA